MVCNWILSILARTSWSVLQPRAEELEHGLFLCPQSGEGLGRIFCFNYLRLLIGIHGAPKQGISGMAEALHIHAHGMVAHGHRDSVPTMADAEIDPLDTLALRIPHKRLAMLVIDKITVPPRCPCIATCHRKTAA